MDEIVYNALTSYFHALSVKGYMPYIDAQKALLLSFYNDYVYGNYRGNLSRDDYYLIERALNCLYGSTCLIPYPEYTTMGKLHLGDTTELAQRIKILEDTNVLKLIHDTERAEGNVETDVIVVAEE